MSTITEDMIMPLESRTYNKDDVSKWKPELGVETVIRLHPANNSKKSLYWHIYERLYKQVFRFAKTNMREGNGIATVTCEFYSDKTKYKMMVNCLAQKSVGCGDDDHFEFSVLLDKA